MGDNPEPEAGDPLIGRVIADKIELVSVLGAGAMGKVYRGHHRALNKAVAIKVLLGEETTAKQIARFEAEARAASRLDHPHSVQVLDFGRDGDDRLCYIVMELLDGRDLRDVVNSDGPLAPARACALIAQVCSALASAHEVGVVHRDVKPSNIMVVPRLDEAGTPMEWVKVCDFGLAKLHQAPNEPPPDGAPPTLEGALFGTPAYMSPEQARGEPLDARSDIYSVGVVLYTLLAGRRPFEGTSPLALAAMHLTHLPPPLQSLVPSLPPGLADVVHTTLAKNRDERFASARDLRAALVPFFDAGSKTTGPAVVHVVRGRASAMIAGAAMAALALIAVLVVAQRARHSDTSEVAPVVQPPPPPAPPVVEAVEAPASITVRIDGPPPGTGVYSAEGWIGDVPGPVELPAGDEAVVLTFRAKGWKTVTRRVLPSRDRTLTVRMKRSVAPKRVIPKRDRLEDPFE